MKRPPAMRRRASSLVTTLLVIAVLTVIVVAFLQSMTVERKTAISYSNIAKAQLAVEAAQSEATTRLAVLMATNPYHAIGYTNLVINGQTNAYTILYGATNAVTATNAAGAPKTYFLCSMANAPTNVLALTNVPAALDATNSVALNRKTGSGGADDPGWMGSPVTTNGSLVYRECRAPWVYLLKDPAKPHQPDKKVADYNPYVARYAWWIEDETSKLDIRLAGNNDGSSGTFRPPQAANLFQPTNTAFLDAPAWKPEYLDLGAAPVLNGKPIATNNASANKLLIDFRNRLANLPVDGRILGQSQDFGSPSEKTSRFYTTQASVSSDLSGNGRRRINLNALVHDESDDKQIIASDLDDIAYAISGTHVFSTRGNGGLFHSAPTIDINALLPNFGDRFWPSTDNRFQSFSVNTATKRSIYLAKIAANIRDYIDADSNPTFVDRSGNVAAGALPSGPPSGIFPDSPEDTSRNGYPQPWAIGRESIPNLQKYGWYFGGDAKGATVDQYLTFFNPSTKDFVAPNGTFLRLFKRLRWNTGSFGGRSLSPCEFDLSGMTFPAGKSVIISADSAPTPNTGASYSCAIYSATYWVRRPIQQCPPISGQTPDEREEGTRRFTGIHSATINSRGGLYEWYTHMVWGNSHGYYGGYGGIGLTRTDNYTAGKDSDKVNTSTGQTMRGNDAASHSGDVRSLEEPLAISDYYLTGSANGDQDQYRFYSDSNPTDLSNPSNFYINPIGDSTHPQWPDYTTQFNSTQDTTYALIRDEPMTSIGELGHIYDPYRRNGNNIQGNNNTGYIEYARGGGRTLRVGQPDEVTVNGINSAQQTTAATAARFNASWVNAAWRLTDLFDVVFDPLTDLVDRTTPQAPAQSEGKINLNSVLRDDGAAFRGLLRKFTYLTKPHGAPTTSNRSLSDAEIDTLISQIKIYLTTKGPFMERGELSQLQFFANGTAGSQAMGTTQDRGREEIFRRILPLLTTRSNSFSVYAIGQTLREDKDGNLTVLSEAIRGQVYRFDPVIGNNLTDKVNSYTTSFLYEHL